MTPILSSISLNVDGSASGLSTHPAAARIINTGSAIRVRNAQSGIVLTQECEETGRLRDRQKRRPSTLRVYAIILAFATRARICGAGRQVRYVQTSSSVEAPLDRSPLVHSHSSCRRIFPLGRLSGRENPTPVLSSPS